MNRKEFLIKTCTACIGTTVLSELFSSCRATQIVTGNLNNDGITVDANKFIIAGKKEYRSYIIVHNEALLYPICVYRFGENTYSALWMECAHQGAELNVSGDMLQCPAHGSEYDNKGHVTNGPADRDLRTFPITLNNDQLFIDLRKT